MAEITLTCGHPAIVTHDSGERLVGCAVPTCRTADVIFAKQVSAVTYHNLTKLGALDEVVADLHDMATLHEEST